MTSKKNVSALVAMSTFKGSLSNLDACRAVSHALRQKKISFALAPIADGGRGTLHCIKNTLGGEIIRKKVSGPLGEPVEARILCLPNKRKVDSIFIESSDCCGHHLISTEKRDAMRASSLGLGELLLFAITQWKDSLSNIYIGLGDSAISDAGMGMLCGLGFIFSSQNGGTLWGNAHSLREIHSIRIPKLPRLKITVLCDVLNPLCGPNGSARVFSPQKGATANQVGLIEQGMAHFAQVIQKQTGKQVKDMPMSGAAGGLAAAFAAFFNAKLVHGARFLLDWIHFDEILTRSNFLITGEGRTDKTTLAGKAPMECAERASAQGKKTLIISGSLGPGYETLLRKSSVIDCVACGDKPSPRKALREKVIEVLSSKEKVRDLEG